MYMSYSSIAAGAALSLGLFVSAAGALAAEEVTAATCQNMESQVRSALDSAPQQTSSQSEAQKERATGHQYCARGFYKIGTEHFAQALKLLTGKA
jgi:hypothetical protein